MKVEAAKWNDRQVYKSRKQPLLLVSCSIYPWRTAWAVKLAIRTLYCMSAQGFGTQCIHLHSGPKKHSGKGPQDKQDGPHSACSSRGGEYKNWQLVCVSQSSIKTTVSIGSINRQIANYVLLLFTVILRTLGTFNVWRFTDVHGKIHPYLKNTFTRNHNKAFNTNCIEPFKKWNSLVV